MKIFKTKFILLIIGILLVSFLTANSQEKSEAIEKNGSVVPDKSVDTSLYLIHFGDLIDVDVIGSTEYDWRGKLTPEGFLDGLNFVEEPIYGLCQTNEEVASKIVKGYGKILRDPQIVVRIIDSSKRPLSFLYGAVKTPQRFQIQRAVRLNELVILSGGITEKSNGQIQILRSSGLSCTANQTTQNNKLPNDKQEENIPAKTENSSQVINIEISDLLKGKQDANPMIFSGDVITVLESKPIYVTGGVENPKQIDIRSEMNVSRAIAGAGGLTKDANPKKITIYRVENKQTKAIEIDFEKVKKGEANDILLQALDVVDVSQKGKKKSKYIVPTNVTESVQDKIKELPLRVID